MKMKILTGFAVAIMLVGGLVISSGSAFAGSSATSTSGSASGSVAASSQGQGQSIDMIFEGSNPNIPDPAAYAPNVTAPGLTTSFSNTCHGSTSGGFSFGNGAVALGATGGNTWKDETCEARLDARLLKFLGFDEAAKARMCQMPAIRLSMKDAGTFCPQDNRQAAADKAAALLWLGNGKQSDFDKKTASLVTASKRTPAQCSWDSAKLVFPECKVSDSLAMVKEDIHQE